MKNYGGKVPKFTKTLKKRWVTAFCCLGVLASICGMKRSIEKTIDLGIIQEIVSLRFLVLPKEIQKKLATMNDNGTPSPRSQTTSRRSCR